MRRKKTSPIKLKKGSKIKDKTGRVKLMVQTDGVFFIEKDDKVVMPVEPIDPGYYND